MAQNNNETIQNNSESWDTYIARYENQKAGTTVVRMDLINKLPIKDYSTILVTGVTYESNDASGFPDDKTLNTVQKIEDDLVKYITEKYKSIYVGSFMHDFKRYGYFYLKDSSSVRNDLDTFYKKNYPNFKNYINLKDDSNWEYYTDFLYPNEDIRNYLSDEKVVNNLIKNGDNLKESRRVDHWSYFNTKQNAEKFKVEIEKFGYKIEEIKKNKNSFKVQFWKDEFVNLDSIYKITTNLRAISTSFQGEYDGWETFVIKN